MVSTIVGICVLNHHISMILGCLVDEVFELASFNWIHCHCDMLPLKYDPLL